MRFPLALAALLGLAAPAIPSSAAVLTFQPNADNSIYSNATGNSNGAGPTLFSGHSGNTNNGTRRALLDFDLSSIPSGAIIDRVELRLTLADAATQETSNRNFSLHRLSTSWGESTSFVNAVGGGTGNGDTADPGDATWNVRFFGTPSTNWATAGGDYLVSASATTSIGQLADVGSSYTWETLRGSMATGLVADVENWLASPANNFGWLLRIDDEAQFFTARRFFSRDYTNVDLSLQAANRPLLTIEYSLESLDAVPEPSSLVIWLWLGLALESAVCRRRRSRRDSTAGR